MSALVCLALAISSPGYAAQQRTIVRTHLKYVDHAPAAGPALR